MLCNRQRRSYRRGHPRVQPATQRHRLRRRRRCPASRGRGPRPARHLHGLPLGRLPRLDLLPLALSSAPTVCLTNVAKGSERATGHLNPRREAIDNPGPPLADARKRPQALGRGPVASGIFRQYAPERKIYKIASISGHVSEINEVGVRAEAGSAKATETETTRRVVPSRATSAQPAYPINSRVRRPELFQKHTCTPLC